VRKCRAVGWIGLSIEISEFNAETRRSGERREKKRERNEILDDDFPLEKLSDFSVSSASLRLRVKESLTEGNTALAARRILGNAAHANEPAASSVYN
jgi:hypothetical protein